MQTLGIDLAARNANTAAVRIDWSGNAATVTEVLRAPAEAPDTSDTWLLEAITRREATVGIDAPFGFPKTMVAAVTGHSQGRRWGTPDPEDLRFRATDKHVTQVTGIRPLSASSDLIAVTAWRCARLLDQLGNPARDGSDGIAETYPAAAIERWGMRERARGYKGTKPTARKARDSMRQALIRRIGPGTLDIPLAVRSACRESDHVLDALLCAIIARAVYTGDTVAAGAGQKRLAKTEGWIHLPEPDSLGRLVRTRRRARA